MPDHESLHGPHAGRLRGEIKKSMIEKREVEQTPEITVVVPPAKN
jgi:hypothetical protein